MDKSRFLEEDFNDFLDDLLKANCLDATEAGVTRQVKGQGYDSLSDKQKKVFDRIISEYTTEYCEMTGEPIPWNEMLEAHDNGGYSSYGQYVKEKMDEDEEEEKDKEKDNDQ